MPKTVNLDLKLHPKQHEIFTSKARFKVVMAGRRFGKTVLSRAFIATGAMETERYGKDIKGTEVWYVAPTYDQAASIMWRPIKAQLSPLIKKTWEQDLVAELLNGRIVRLRGAEHYDRLRGVGLSDLVLDEYASMKPDVWEYVLAPALADIAPASRALFIGTPNEFGGEHFDQLFDFAEQDKSGAWESWSFKTIDNPYIDPREIEAARSRMTEQAFMQEFEATRTNMRGKELPPVLLIVQEKTELEGHNFMTVDLAGFASSKEEKQAQLKHKDESAICVVNVSESGWHIVEIQHGQWNVRETATRILAMARKHRPERVGIEKGALKNALSGYLQDQQRKFGIHLRIEDLHHNKQSKQERIRWALAGRLEHGQLSTNPGPWVKPLRKQMRAFPAERMRDDIIDALAYVDQIAFVMGKDVGVYDTWAPFDRAVGY
jgi:predicted phage terminase large subunit-like protein